MSFGLVPGSFAQDAAGAPLSLSLPNTLRLAIFDSGTGGSFLLTGLGAAIAAAVGSFDIAALVNANGGQFRSGPLLTAFRPYTGTPSVGFSEVQLAALDVSCVPWNNPTGSTATPGWRATFNPAAPGAPIMQIVGPGVAGTWYMTIRLRGAIGE
jgi:hypothetical protein